MWTMIVLVAVEILVKECVDVRVVVFVVAMMLVDVDVVIVVIAEISYYALRLSSESFRRVLCLDRNT